MRKEITVGDLKCLSTTDGSTDRIAYILYPMDMLSEWIEPASRKYGTAIVAITGMDWQNVFSPWPSKGVPTGTPDFKGESAEFLKVLQNKVIPKLDAELRLESGVERTLVGVSMSGLFALWQWAVCDTFDNIISMSGSFWYDGFVDWFLNRKFPEKCGKAFFLLGRQESKSPVRKFNSVETDTKRIVERLEREDVSVSFLLVPGNHYVDPIPRLEASFDAMYNQGSRHAD